MNKILGWHFTSTTMRDGSPLAEPGETETFNGKIEICSSGLHGSESIIDALLYATGTILRRTENWGDLVRENDKFACRYRRILWEVNATQALSLFARMCALDVAHLRNDPPIVRQYLLTGDKSIRAEAHDAAWAAWTTWKSKAPNAARKSAWAAWVASKAAWTSSDVAWTSSDVARVAREAAWAARAAAWASSEAATAAPALRKKQERRLINLVQAARCGWW